MTSSCHLAMLLVTLKTASTLSPQPQPMIKASFKLIFHSSLVVLKTTNQPMNSLLKKCIYTYKKILRHRVGILLLNSVFLEQLKSCIYKIVDRTIPLDCTRRGAPGQLVRLPLHWSDSASFSPAPQRLAFP